VPTRATVTVPASWSACLTRSLSAKASGRDVPPSEDAQPELVGDAGKRRLLLLDGGVVVPVQPFVVLKSHYGAKSKKSLDGAPEDASPADAAERVAFDEQLYTCGGES
jgi:hypothetical protein